MNRNYTYRKHQKYVHIKRKYNIIKNYWSNTDEEIQRNSRYWPMHKLHKNKVHCSCPYCQRKISNSGMKHADLINYAKGQEMDSDRDVN